MTHLTSLRSNNRIPFVACSLKLPFKLELPEVAWKANNCNTKHSTTARYLLPVLAREVVGLQLSGRKWGLLLKCTWSNFI